MQTRFFSWLALCMVVLIAGCASPMRGRLDAYPPVANDRAPGASSEARAAAQALGRGINLGNMLEAPREGDWGLVLKDAYIDAVVQAGFHTVRLPVRWSNHAGTRRPFLLDAGFAARVEGIVDRLLARDLRVILDMHHYRQLDGDAPDPGDEAQDASLADERFLALWQQIALRFGDRSDRLLFELYNEPHGLLDAPHWNELLARAVGVVRKSNPRRILLVGPIQWNNAAALRELRLPNDAHLIASVHNYAPFKFTHQGAPWISPLLPTGVSCCDGAQQAELVAPLDLAKTWSEWNNYPVFIGEFGAYKDAAMDARVRYTTLAREQIEARGFSWAYWEFASHFGIYDPVLRRFNQPLLEALIPPAAAAKVHP